MHSTTWLCEFAPAPLETGTRNNTNFCVFSTPLIIAYPAEIWPYQLRARGIALTQMSTYGAIFFNIFVNPIALESIGWKYYLVFAVILVVITVTVYFFYPETKGHSLEEMAVVFDGIEAERISEGGVRAVKGTATEVKHTEETEV